MFVFQSDSSSVHFLASCFCQHNICTYGVIVSAVSMSKSITRTSHFPETVEGNKVGLQVGQCGNQIGSRFWEMALQEHAATSNTAIYDEPLSSFFTNVDSSRTSSNAPLPVGSPISKLKAHAILVDTEEGVLKQLQKSAVGEIFDTSHIVSDQYGAGNNWAQGHLEYGGKYKHELLERVQKTVEVCDSLQSFMLLHSLGGGTGSGLGTFILSLLADEFPDIYRFTASVFPSEDDDVVTSPYNALLALHQLSQHADCVLPIDNKALSDICQSREESASKEGARVAAGVSGVRAESFDAMNDIAASMLTHLTASMRFKGSLNVDLNEITMNLVPYPRLKFLLSSVSPLHSPSSRGVAPVSCSSGVDAMFSEVFHRDSQLIKSDPKRSTYLACALMARGQVPISNNLQHNTEKCTQDFHRNVERIKKSVDIIHWNPDGFKIGLCSVPPAAHPRALLCLANNCCIATPFSHLHERFLKLYTNETKEYMDVASENVRQLVNDYTALDHQPAPSCPPPRFRPVV